ncbi:MAG: transglutaminase domain-containing protein [Eggerthellaceae bacterium]|nr:transglutaminase domain-containing protein [Eggerthellaceae bacterium]
MPHHLRFCAVEVLREHEVKTKAQREQSICRSMLGLLLATVCTLCTAFLLFGCASSPAPTPASQPTDNETPTASGVNTGYAAEFHDAEFNPGAAETDGVNYIDLSHTQDGYIGAASENDNRLKLQVTQGDMSYNYDLPNTGEPIIVPVNMGNGNYAVRIMQNTTGDRYIELFSATADISLSDELAPFVRPNVFCNYSRTSASTQLASELCANAANESEAFDAVYEYIVNNISYDYEKAAQLATVTGYIPNPDETLESGSGICFDYASLAAAMLRSQGIPTKILTGYVSPDNVYHAWDMIYINGSWASLHISAQPGRWARADLTFAANGAADIIGDGSAYADRYTY